MTSSERSGTPPAFRGGPRLIRETLAAFRHTLLALIAVATLHADSAPITAPAHNWILPLFSPLGYRTLTLRGNEARLTDKDHIDVTEINVTIFSGDQATLVTTSVLSSQATYVPSLNLAYGPGHVRIIRLTDNSEASGEDWSYDFAHEKVSIHRNVRVVFHQALNDFLK